MQSVSPNSSAISRLDYDEPSKSLIVTFVKGGTDTLENVSQSTFNDFKNAPSVGVFYNQYAKGQK